MPAGTTLGDSFVALQNSMGQVAFSAPFSGTQNGWGIWKANETESSLIVCSGEQCLSPHGVPLGELSVAGLNDSGDLLFYSSSRSPGLWLQSRENIACVIQRGDSPPGLAGHSLTWFGALALQADGTVIVEGGNASARTHGVWMRRSDRLEQVAISGQPVVGASKGDLFLGIDRLSADYSLTRGSSWAATGAVGNGDGVPHKAIFSVAEGAMSVEARLGGAAPGQPPGTVYTDLGTPRTTAGGDLSFSAIVRDAAGYSSVGFYSSRQQKFVAVAPTGAWLPEHPEAPSIDCMGLGPVNTQGNMVFRAFVGEPNEAGFGDDSLWMSFGRAASLVARQGDPAPGMPAGQVFSQFCNRDGDVRAALNERGDMVFLASIKQLSVAAEELWGVWARRQDGVLLHVLAPGDLLETVPGVFKRVANVNSFGSPTNMPPLSEAGELLLTVRFSDGSAGIYIAIVPEPSTLLCAIALVLLHLIRAGVNRAHPRIQPR